MTKILFLQILLSPLIMPQVTGVVLDRLTKDPITGVNIYFDEIGTVTNQRGEFAINVKLGSKVEFSHIGYVLLDSFSMGQVLCLPMIIAGILIFIYSRKNA